MGKVSATMKLSLAWIFDHLTTSWKKHDIPALLHRFSVTTAEIDSFAHLTLNPDHFTLARITSISADTLKASSDELKKEFSLASHEQFKLHDLIMLKQRDGAWHLARESDIGGSKESILPPLFVAEKERAGGWKKHFEREDYILTIDNINFSHRPDLWGHRGIAREFGALLKCDLVPEDELIIKIPVKIAEKEITQDRFKLAIDRAPSCKRFAALSVEQCANHASSLSIAHRLIRVDSKPISALVDATNYSMFDWGQPLHAFDAQKVATNQLVVKESSAGQNLMLLDGHDITLQKGDLVITDGKKPIALAGVMGGQETAVTSATNHIFVEAATYVAKTIRSTSLHYKIRTEASTRFEKSLDPENTGSALERFLKILQQSDIAYTKPHTLLVVGETLKPHTISVSHAFLERLLGVSLDEQFVASTLTRLSFGVKKETRDGQTAYVLQVPSFRSTKDVLNKQDIVEEIGRFFGYDAIAHQLPRLPSNPANLLRFERINAIKEYMAYAGRAHETRNYAVYDEEFLKLLSWDPGDTVAIKNPVSHTMFRLVTSLVPNLIKNVHTNATHKDAFNFFEINKIWHRESDHKLQEKTSFAAIFFDAKKEINFFEKKELCAQLFSALALDVAWQKSDKHAPWFHPYQTARLEIDGKLLGYAGMAYPAFLHKAVEGSAFVLELDGDMLLELSSKVALFKPLHKYQDSWRDISMLIPLTITVSDLERRIKDVSPLITSVELIDYFQKKEWHDVRSVTMRFSLASQEKTLVSEEVDAVSEMVTNMVKKLGATIR